MADDMAVIEAVLFDYGGTLVTFTYPRDCLLAMLEQVGPWLGDNAPAPERLLEVVQLPLEDDLRAVEDGIAEVAYLPLYRNAWQRAGLTLTDELLWRVLVLEQRCWDGAAVLVEDAPEVLARLRRRGIRTGICSNAVFPPELLHRQLAHLGLDALFDAVVFSSAVGRRKPAPEIYAAALAAVGGRPETTLFVGDRVDWDYEAPVRLGMRAVICTALIRGDAPPPGVPTISRLRELEALL